MTGARSSFGECFTYFQVLTEGYTTPSETSSEVERIAAEKLHRSAKARRQKRTAREERRARADDTVECWKNKIEYCDGVLKSNYMITEA